MSPAEDQAFEFGIDRDVHLQGGGAVFLRDEFLGVVESALVEPECGTFAEPQMDRLRVGGVSLIMC